LVCTACVAAAGQGRGAAEKWMSVCRGAGSKKREAVARADLELS
jgi:hypothetical protein